MRLVANVENGMNRQILKAWGNFAGLNYGLFSLGSSNSGNIVRVDLIDEANYGKNVPPDSSLTGVLEDGRNCLIRLLDTDCPVIEDFIGQQIGLSVKTYIPTPVGSVETLLHSTIRKGGQAAFYLPHAVDPNRNFGWPTDDQYYWPVAKYGKLCVNGETFFDHTDNYFGFYAPASNEAA